jgi:nitrite reductase (NADH) large subunit
VVRDRGRVTGIAFADGVVLPAELVVISAGIRPRDELARSCGLDVVERGGVVIGDDCRTSDPAIFAVGECAAHQGRVHGLVAPGYAMARVAADQLARLPSQFSGAPNSTKLKLLGVDLASFGDAHATTEGCRTVTWHDETEGVYRKLVTDPDGTRLIGGVLVGDTEDFPLLNQLYVSGAPLPRRPAHLAVPTSAGGAPLGVGALADDALVCNCNNVTKAAICAAIKGGCSTVGEIGSATRAGTGCKSCEPLVKSVLGEELERRGIAIDRSLCEHFDHTRQELFDIVRVRRIRTFTELLEGWGRGRGCAVCKPAVASMLASLWNEYILDEAHRPLQDTNDAFLANVQRDGSYSVVPRVPAGEITPDQLITIGQVAKEFNLYTKITGGQRVDLFGARVDQLPAIWRRLIDAGFESGHAYGKALRTVKSCVGTTWCRYGVQDSTALAIDLELRYRGLRSPHKIKAAVSGCARECAEAQSKDVGVIATERGWNLYVCGNGGMRPQHAALLASDVDRATLITSIDRFLMFYVRTADRLERTATWLNRLDGGIDYLRAVVMEDSLGIAGELEAAMADHVATYRCEWEATLADPERVAKFRHFVNTDVADPTLVYLSERGQKRPARRVEPLPAAP